MKERIIEETARLLNKNALSFKIKGYLQSEKLSEREIEAYLNIAKQRAYDQKLISLPKKYKFKFGLALSIAFIRGKRKSTK